MKLSIITINYNNAIDLGKTIKSVLEQTWKEFEYIIIDGGSNDGSLSIIKEYEEQIDQWVSEPDKGIYNAMNKGILKATGDYLLMLNAGDLLNGKNILAEIFSDSNYQEDILYGDAILESNGKVFGNKTFSNPITFDFFRKTSLSHQACFIKRELHNLVGLYDEQLKFASDWKFLILSICKYNVSIRYINKFIAVCNCDGLTWNPKNFPAMRKEMDAVYDQHFPAFVADYIIFDQIRNKQKFFKNINKNIKDKIKNVLRPVLNK